jgi:hypothetical protein
VSPSVTITEPEARASRCSLIGYRKLIVCVADTEKVAPASADEGRTFTATWVVRAAMTVPPDQATMQDGS